MDGGREAPVKAEPTVVQVVPLLGVRSLGTRAFDYRVPPQMAAVAVGSIVRVPFGRRRVRGVVTAVGASGEVPAERIAPLADVAAERLDPASLALALHLAERYLAPLGACLQAVGPPRPSFAADTRARPVQWIERAPAADGGAPFPGMTATEAPSLPARQAALLAVLPPGGAPASELLSRAGVSRSVLRALLQKGLVTAESRVAGSPTPQSDGAGPAAAGGPPAAGPEGPPAVEGAAAAAGCDGPPVLSEEQAAALAQLAGALSSGGPERRVLWGVTGSGKTEVYLRLVQQALAAGRSALVLVPEIALTGQTLQRLRSRLGPPVAVLHSGLGAARRAAEYAQVASGEARVVLGARSAVFAPLAGLGLIVVDEAHDDSYKQAEEPRYDAREVAWWRAGREKALLVEVTATPRVESLVLAAPPLELRSPAKGGGLPAVEAVDLRYQGGPGVLAPCSREAIKEALARAEQVIVLLNRRGHSSFLRCDLCGHVLMCPHCEIALTYHRSQRALLCHHCGHREPPRPVCPACQGGPLSRGSPGTERLGEELLRLVPRSQLFRLDSDVVTSGTRVEAVLDAFARAHPGVLVGTQMVAKGHDFPDVGLVVVADADTGLYMPDFRAAERTFALLTQVAGRAGRAATPGRVLVQTWNPEVPCIRMALARQDRGFYAQELAARERLGYPPFRRLTRIVLSGRGEERVEPAAAYLARRLAPYLDDDELLGPARLPTIARKVRRHLVVAARDGARSRELLRHALSGLREPYARRGVDLIVDVDPQSFG